MVDIGYGGTFYAFLSAEQLGLDVCSSKTRDLVSAASAVTEAVKKQVGHCTALNAADYEVLPVFTNLPVLFPVPAPSP